MEARIAALEAENEEFRKALMKPSPLPLSPPAPGSPPSPPPPPPALTGVTFYSDMSTLTDGKLQDLSGNANHGAIKSVGGTATASQTGGVAGGGAYSFPDFGAYVELPANDGTVISGSKPRSVCYWTKGTGQDASDYPFGFGKDCSGNSGTTFNARFSSGGKMGFMGCADDESGKSTSMSASTDSWQHVCYTYDGSSLKVYVDGAHGVTWSKSLQTVAASSGGVARIGSHTGASYATSKSDLNGVNGMIDEFYILDHAVTGAEIAIMRCFPFRSQGKVCPYV